MPKCNVAMTACESSQLSEIGYDPATRTLAVRFKPNTRNTKGAVYTYANVEPELHAEFQAAESKGRFFKDRVKGHADRYPFTKVVEDDDEQAAA